MASRLRPVHHLLPGALTNYNPLTISADDHCHGSLAHSVSDTLEKWGAKYPPIVQSWRRNWEQVIPFFAYPAEVRRVIYTTNAIESLHMTLRKILKKRGSFPTDDAATKLLYLGLRDVKKGGKRSIREWTAALNQFAILFDDRLAASARWRTALQLGGLRRSFVRCTLETCHRMASRLRTVHHLLPEPLAHYNPLTIKLHGSLVHRLLDIPSRPCQQIFAALSQHLSRRAGHFSAGG
ncbi:MAG: transposase [Reyranella sp.]|nr:transposase [Reyranella sp.]